MNWLDLLLLLALVLAARRGFHRGLVPAAWGWLGAGAGLIAAYHLYPALAKWITFQTGLPPWLARPAAFAGMAVGIAGGAHLLELAWDRWVPGSPLWRWDRVAGAGFGVVQAALVVIILLVAWAELPGGTYRAPLEGSLVAHWLLRLVPDLFYWIEATVGPYLTPAGGTP